MRRRLAVAAALMCCTGAARADYEGRIVGNWLTNATEDRFGDGGTYTAVVADGRTGLVVRCIRKKLSLAILEVGGDPKPLNQGDTFELKFKIDKQPIVDAKGLAISARLIQIVTEASLVKSIRDGRETAMRVATSSGVVTSYVFKTGGAKKALADLSKECPLD
jgi:hypothetical protein